MAEDREVASSRLRSRGTFTPEYARGYLDGFADGYTAGVRAASSAIEELASQGPPAPTDISISSEDDDLDQLGLSPRALGVLHRGGVKSISQLRQRGRKLWGLYGMGPKLMDEIIAKSAEQGITIHKW